MNEIFNEDGHISDFGFEFLVENKLDEMQSLEVAEHLSYCDECIEKYSEILSNITLIEPPETFTVSTLKCIKQKTLRLIYNKYFSAAVAAGFAIFLWVSGIFNINVVELNKNLELTPTSNKPAITDSFSAKFNSAIDSLSSIYGDKKNGGKHEEK